MIEYKMPLTLVNCKKADIKIILQTRTSLIIDITINGVPASKMEIKTDEKNGLWVNMHP